MADKIYIGAEASDVQTSDRYEAYTQVILTNNGVETFRYPSGETTGRILYVENPYGTQTICRNIYNKVHGYSYQPLEIMGANVTPAVEIGDAVTAAGKYSGVFAQSTNFGHYQTNDLKASGEAEIDHEYPFGTINKYATYSGLREGSTEVNGKGLTPGSVKGSADLDEGELSAIAAGTISTSNTSNGINNSLGYANFASDIFSGLDTATTVRTTSQNLLGHEFAGFRYMTANDGTVVYVPTYDPMFS